VNTIVIDQNMMLASILVSLGLLIYGIIKYTTRGRKTARTFQKKQRAWLQKEQKFLSKLIKWFLAPVILFWIFVSTVFTVFADYYFHNVIFEPLFGFTPMQTFIATILILVFIYLIYSYIKRGGAKK